MKTTKPQSNNLKDCKVEIYKIDNDEKVLYKVTNSGDLQLKMFKSMPLEQLETTDIDFFFMLMKNFQCEDFTMYYESDYDIIKIISLLYNEELNLTPEQLVFLKKLFNNIKVILIALFDKNRKPLINNLTDSTISNNNSISKALDNKPRILN